MVRTNSLLFIFACVAGLLRMTCIGSEVVTLSVNSPGIAGAYSPTTITLAAGDVATLEASTHFYSPMVEFTVATGVFLESLWTRSGPGGTPVLQPIKIAGPASIRFGIPPDTYSEPISVWGTFSITRATALENAIPANAVVIPEDAGGQFQVILESSTDLVNWQAANPGNYGGSTQRRFFRTRIVRVN